MTRARLRLLVAAPILSFAVALAPSSAPAISADACNGQVDVVLGTPSEDVEGAVDAGRVTLVFESDDGTFGNAADVSISEEDLGGTAAEGARFGAALAWGFDDIHSPGCSMVAIGAPGADGGSGKVYVFVADKDGIDPSSIKVLTQGSGGLGDSPEAGDGFGASLFFGGDLAVRWLAIGAPNEDIGSRSNAGMVHIVPITAAWDGESVTHRQGSGPVPGKAQAGDRFGAALGPGYNVYSLWVGVPGEDVGSKPNAGLIDQLPGKCPNGCVAEVDTVTLPGTMGGVKAITQNSPRVPGKAEGGDQFGEVLSGYVTAKAGARQPVVGIPHENVGKRKDAGVIAVAYQDKSWAAFQQGTKGSNGRIDGSPESGDLFGAALSAFNEVILVGVPGEDLGSSNDTGMVHRMTASPSTYRLSGSREQSVSEATAGVLGAAETGDRFGSSLSFSVNGAVVGAPGEDLARGAEIYTDAGVVHFLPFKASTFGALSTGADLMLGAGDAYMNGSFQNGAGFGATGFSITQ